MVRRMQQQPAPPPSTFRMYMDEVAVDGELTMTSYPRRPGRPPPRLVGPRTAHGQHAARPGADTVVPDVEHPRRGPPRAHQHD